MKYSYTIDSIKGTDELGTFLGTKARPGDIILLDGDLGAGKTTLTQFIAKGLGVPSTEYVTSPSFAILHEYQGRIPLYHMDLYRLGGEDEVVDLGFDEYFYGVGLCVIEWPVRAGSTLPKNCLSLTITLRDENTREVVLETDEDSFWSTEIQQYLG